MINLSLDRHDFVAAVESLARSSHLRQHVWHRIVFSSIPQMTDDEMDFFWFVFRRNLWDYYFYKDNNKCMVKRCGHEDYLHALAALHRGNRYKVACHTLNTKNPITVECYRFGGYYRPLYIPGQESRLCAFDNLIPTEWIVEAVAEPMPQNKYVEIGKEKWWTDFSIYDDESLL